MDQPRWVPQLYGYAVCLVAVVTILLSLHNLINGAFDLSQPGMARGVSGEFRGRSLEMCKQRYVMMSMSRFPGTGSEAQRIPSDSVLVQLCTEERESHIAMVTHNAFRSMVRSALLLLVAVGLFVVHWRWVRGLRAVVT